MKSSSLSSLKDVTRDLKYIFFKEGLLQREMILSTLYSFEFAFLLNERIHISMWKS